MQLDRKVKVRKRARRKRVTGAIVTKRRVRHLRPRRLTGTVAVAPAPSLRDFASTMHT